MRAEGHWNAFLPPSRGGPADHIPVAFRTEADLWNLCPGVALIWRLSKEVVMDKEHIKGAADKAKGAVKDAAGKLTGDKELQAEGKMDKAKGSAREAVGDVKDAVRHSTDK
jgi:uncharacterized protein YjbJ (UPF0337 family)